ncbi:hypothetical protein AB4144_59025, partial [Rhizobiaceae sp. 2RAB30]
GQIEVQRLFEFLGDLLVEVLGGRRFLRHAAVTLYSLRGTAAFRPFLVRTCGSLWSCRIVVGQTGKGNTQTAGCLKV